MQEQVIKGLKMDKVSILVLLGLSTLTTILTYKAYGVTLDMDEYRKYQIQMSVEKNNKSKIESDVNKVMFKYKIHRLIKQKEKEIK